MAQLHRYPATVDPDLLACHLLEDGCVVVEGVLPPSQLATLQQEVEPYLAGRRGDATNNFMGDRTIRFGRLLQRVPTTRQLVLDPRTHGTAHRLLHRFSPTTQVHFTSVMHVQEGAAAQVLHRDISPFPNPGPTVVVAAMWAASDFRRDNGATVVVPGSHLWPDRRVPMRNELQVAEMSAGSVLLYAGNLIHGAGACKRGYRTGVALQYCVGWMRQEENQYLAVPINMVRTFSPELQRVMGYDLAARHWGYVDQMHPMEWLTGDPVEGDLDPEGYQFPGNILALRAEPDGLHLDHRYHVSLDDA